LKRPLAGNVYASKPIPCVSLINTVLGESNNLKLVKNELANSSQKFLRKPEKSISA
jgi:hypothetical protein